MNVHILVVVLMSLIKICRPERDWNETISLRETEETSRSRDYSDGINEAEDGDLDLDFDYDDGTEEKENGAGKSGVQMPEKQTKEEMLQQVLLKAMKKPAIKEQIGQVIPILRVMTPTQRLTLAALVSSQIMSQNGLGESNLSQIASMFAGKNVENVDDRHNITEHLLLPISMDIAKMFRGLGRDFVTNLRQESPRNLNSIPRPVKRNKIVKRPFGSKSPIFANRRNDVDVIGERNETSTVTTTATRTTTATTTATKSSPKAEALIQPTSEDCEYFSKNLCLEVSNYPEDAIISSLKRHEGIMETLLIDFKTQSADENVDGVTSQQENKYQAQHYLSRTNRRQDGENEIRDFGSEGGYMCPSSVKYARPKRARTTTGHWKYIVNTGEYTQTLRLEMCLKPLASCSYVTGQFKSQCSQVFNYHRLLTWDEKKGLHMDIFKVPSCCSCHIQGYATLFPPNDFAFAEKRKEPPTVNDHGVSDTSQRHVYQNFGGKREIPRPIHGQYAPSAAPIHGQYRPNPPPNPHRQQQQQQPLQPHDPADHLVPPGPPLPLDNERNSVGGYDLKLEASGHAKRGPVEYNRRYPNPTEITRMTNKVTDRAEIGRPPEGTNFGFRVNQQSRPNPPQKPRIVTSQIRGPKPKPDEGSMFVTPNPDNDVVLQPGSKIDSKPPLHYFNPDVNEINKKPNFFVTPLHGKVSFGKEKENNYKRATPTTTTTTTTKAPQKSESITATGQKRVNYNYHPIIDFFMPENGNRASSSSPSSPSFPSSHSFPSFASQEWTPLIDKSESL